MEFGFKEKLISAALLLVVIIAAWYFLFYGSMQSEIESNKQRILSLQSQINNTISDAGMIESLKVEIEELEATNVRNQSLIVPVDSIQFVSNYIEAQCLSNNLKITSALSADKETLFGIANNEEASPGIKMVKIDMQVEGTFFDLGNFLESFPSFPFLIKAGEITMDTDDESYPMIYTSIKVYVFFKEAL